MATECYPVNANWRALARQARIQTSAAAQNLAGPPKPRVLVLQKNSKLATSQSQARSSAG